MPELGATGFPLSHGQRALWFLHRLAPASPAYNAMSALRILSPLALPALERAFRAVVDRHPALRSTCHAVDGIPRQRVHPRLPPDFATADAASWSRADLDRRLAHEAHRPFDLERGPLVRVRVFSRAPEEHVLLLVVHHIAVDIRSMVTLLEDLSALYAAAVRGLDDPLPESAASFERHVARQLETLAGPELERLSAWWRLCLAGPLPRLALPADHPRPAVQSFRGHTAAVRIPPELAARAAALAAARGVAREAVWLGLFQAYLHRTSGQDRVTVGTPATGRWPGSEGIVGYFVNPVVVLSEVALGTSLARWIERTAAHLEEALAHQELPFPLLVEQLQPTRDASGSPLFQALFVFYREDRLGVLSLLLGEPGRTVVLGDLTVEPFPLAQRAAMLDLTLTLVEAGGELCGSLQCDADLFEAATVERLSGGFTAFASAVLTAPEEPLSPELGFAGAAQLRTVSRRPAGEELDSASAVLAGTQLSLFYFASEDRGGRSAKYELLVEGARFADRHGFTAVWTPERHFHPFGGLYPNPAVTGAAVAALTERVSVRAGSLVAPLHHPVRIAEDWSVVDNLSGGRVGVAFASGWHADDFALAPGDYHRRKQVLIERIETVRRLWRGETVTMPGGTGEAAVRLFPRPVQPELPIWLTTFGDPASFRLAGTLRASVLTHLLGQTVELLEHKIAVYREAWQAAGHPGRGHVTLMLHTFLGDDDEQVRQTVRSPFSVYLRTCTDLLAGLAPALGLDSRRFGERDLDALVAFAFERSCATSALFGTVESCAPKLSRLQRAGVDEIACLIDFGVAPQEVFESLERLHRLHQRCNAGATAPPRGEQGIERAAVRREMMLRRSSRPAGGPEEAAAWPR